MVWLIIIPLSLYLSGFPRHRASATWTWLSRVKSRVWSGRVWAPATVESINKAIRASGMGGHYDMKLGMRSYWLLLCVLCAHAQRAPLFKDEILPVLEKSCTKCHGAQQKMGGLDLSTFTGVMKGGASGPAIRRHHTSRRRLRPRGGWQRARHTRSWPWS